MSYPEYPQYAGKYKPKVDSDADLSEALERHIGEKRGRLIDLIRQADSVHTKIKNSVSEMDVIFEEIREILQVVAPKESDFGPFDEE